MTERCAARNHPGFDVWDWTWRRSDEWDRENANKNELEAREPDMDQVWQAIHLCEADKVSDALLIWRDLAEQGSVWSMIEIGRCYEFGRGVTRDPVEAEQWYHRASVGGSQLAMLQCAKAAASRQDFTRCEEILNSGLEQDGAPAIFWLAWYRYKQSGSRETYRNIRPLLERAAKRGHPAARMILGNFMVRGKFGLFRIPRGFKLAVDWANCVANRPAVAET
jgi:TPR repeat protein